MKRMVGYVFVKKLTNWRGLDFLGLSFGRRWFVGFVRFDHVTDRQRAKP